MKRFLALLGAAVMVVGAIVVRDLLDDSGDGGGGGAGGGGTLELICGPDLVPVCNEVAAHDGGGEGADPAVQVTVEAEQVTAGRLASGELTLDRDTAWLAAGPWPEITAAGGAELPRLAGSEVLARSPAVIVARDDRMAAIEATCGTASWACIGEQAGAGWTALGGESTWGRVEVVLPAPDTGGGTVAVNQAVASKVGTGDFATNDLDDDPATAAWFDRLASESNDNETSTGPLEQFLRVPGSLGVVGTLEASAVTQLSRAAAADTLEVVAPEPVVTADVRLWAADEDTLATALDRLGRERLSTALRDNGWRVVGPDGPEAPSVRGGASIGSAATPLPDTDGLPAPGVTSAVNTRWESA